MTKYTNQSINIRYKYKTNQICTVSIGYPLTNPELM